MTRGLQRFQHSNQSHFVTFSCYRRLPLFASPELFDLFVRSLEEMRRRFEILIYGYVVMPEHVHLLMSEPEVVALAEAIHFLKLSFAKKTRGLCSVASQVGAPKIRASCGKGSERGANLGHEVNPLACSGHAMRYEASESFWQKRYHDRNVRDYREFKAKLRYLHRNPVKRRLVKDAAEWRWSSFRHYALGEVGVVEIESEWTAQDREGGRYGVLLLPS